MREKFEDGVSDMVEDGMSEHCCLLSNLNMMMSVLKWKVEMENQARRTLWGGNVSKPMIKFQYYI